MSSFAGYHGEDFSPAGDKGRYVLPADFRNGIKIASGGIKKVCLARHPEWKQGWKCLIGFDVKHSERLEDQLRHMEELATRRGEKFDEHHYRNQMFSFTSVPFDDSGRFIIPGKLKRRAMVDSGLFVKGMGTYFAIWTPEMLDALSKRDDLGEFAEEVEDLVEDCKDAMAEAAAKSRKRGG